MVALRIVGERAEGPANGHDTDRRRRILEAATLLFAEAPFDAVQVDDIARAAGVAKPTLYRYFATKEILFAEAIEGALEGLKAKVRAIARGPGPADERLRALVCVMFAGIGRLKAVIVALDSSAATLGDQGRAVLRRELKHVRGEIAQLWLTWLNAPPAA